jgi:hypothetical protein
MAALLSPLQLYAGSALLQNQGIRVIPELTVAIDEYTSVPLLGNLIATIAANILLPSTQTALQTFAGNIGNSCPALADSILDNITTIVSSTSVDPGLTGIITLTANTYLGNGDVGKFAQIFTGAISYADITNIFINSAVNAENYLGGTFTNMNTLVTGGLTDVNLATQAMGDDLYNAGYWIDLANLENLGTPLALIQQISQQARIQQAGTTALLSVALVNSGVPDSIISKLNDPNLVVTDLVQQIMYQALTTITGPDLAQILQILQIWTPDINTLADLLNPAVMLPNSYSSLTTPTADGLRGIYITAEPATPYPSLADEATAREVPRPLACEIRQSDNPYTVSGTTPGNTGTGAIYTVNSNLATTLPPYGFDLAQLSIITSPGLALANKAFANALLQITNISRMTLPQLSAAFLAIETNKDLPLINDQSQVIPQSAIDYYKNTLATGSGDNGTILLTDIIGTAVGTNMIDNLSNCVTIINSLYDAGELDNLITIYNDMYAALPDDALIGNLIANAQIEISSIIAANPIETTNLNTYFSGIGTQLTNEVNFQNLATLSVANVASNSQVSTQGFVFSLPSFGQDTKVGGTAQYLEDITDISIGGGQAIIATLRDGRSQTGLSAAGVNNAANAVPADPAIIPPQATLIPSIVSEREARSQIIY